jgi:tetratricopeptide (TPR) repeat protein
MGWLTNPTKVLDHKHDIVGQSEARWLLIFDNADTPETLIDYWPVSSSGSILVTSRDPLSKTTPSIASMTVDLNPMLAGDGVQLLQRLSDRAQDVDLASEICERLGGLPLAISQMAAIIRYQYLTFADFLEKYDNDLNRKKLLAHEEEKGRREEARGNASTIWAVDRLDQPPRILMQVCSMLDPDGIEERILENHDAATAILPEYPQDWMAYSIARAELIKRSLVLRSESSKELRIHRLVQESVKGEMGDGETLTVFSVAVALILKAWDVSPLAKRHVWALHKKRAGLFPHARTLRAVYEQLYLERNPPVSISMAELMNEAAWLVLQKYHGVVHPLMRRNTGCILTWPYRWHHERGISQESKPFWTLARNICHKNDSKTTDQLLADIHYGLAAAANETSDTEGNLYHTEILLRMRLQAAEASGTSDMRLAIAYNQRAIALSMNREYDKAIAACQKSIDIFKELDEFVLALDTNPRTNLGFTYWVIGDLENAYSTLYSLLQDRESRFGPDDSESWRYVHMPKVITRFDWGAARAGCFTG